MATAEMQTASVNGVQLAYFDEGAGVPLLMVHGWPQHSYCWRRLTAYLVTDYRVIGVDLRGCGDSEAVEEGFDKKTLAADIVALCDHLGLDEVVVVGHDWGGPIAYRFALDNTERTLAVVVFNGRMPLLARHIDLMFTPQQVRERWYFNFNLVLELPEIVIGRCLAEYLDYLYCHWSGGKSIHSPEDMNEYLRVPARPHGLRAGLGLYRTAVTKDVDDWQEHGGRVLKMPNLVLWGARDPVLPPIYVEGLNEVLSDLEVHVHQEAGHFLQEEVPEWCASRMRDFLSRRIKSVSGRADRCPDYRI